MFEPVNNSRKKIQKRSWTDEEDAKLLELVRIHGSKVGELFLDISRMAG